MRKIYIQIIWTSMITYIYCLIWVTLEVSIYGSIQIRLVDDIMMLLFIPPIWISVNALFEKYLNRKEKDNGNYYC